jgi:uncharacterized protein YbjT (DUF2867 family)
MEATYDLYCKDLPTKAIMGQKILVTGATGYIGGELIPELVARGYMVRVMVRSFIQDYVTRWPEVEIVEADVLEYDQLEKAVEGIDCIYYLIHSLYHPHQFMELDRQAADNLSKAAEKFAVKRIIYLGSLGNTALKLSDHLWSRHQVAKILQEGKTPVTFLRAAVIIGSGSASYRIIHHLVKNCPVFVFPSWADSECQPIAISDVIKYLIGCLETKETAGQTLDIGGPEILTYRMILKNHGKVLKKKRLYLDSGISSVKLYSNMACIFTPISYKLIKVLMESCINHVVCQNTDVQTLVPFKTVNYIDATRMALQRESQLMHFKKWMHNENKHR